MSERELNSLMFYKFCMSQMTTWKPCVPPPFFRQLAMTFLFVSLMTKFVIYLRMWRTVSRTARKDLPESFQGTMGEI